MRIKHFSFSRIIYCYFPELFRMNLKIFEEYLSSLYLSTNQMKSICLSNIHTDENICESSQSIILDKHFIRKYGGNKQIDQDLYKLNDVVPTNSMQTNKTSKEHKIIHSRENLKRVSLKAIEFDWLLNTHYGAEFLNELSVTSNINIFALDIIKDIIYFQWNYVKAAIIKYLMIPYIIYFVMFWVYATYIAKNKVFET